MVQEVAPRSGIDPGRDVGTSPFGSDRDREAIEGHLDGAIEVGPEDPGPAGLEAPDRRPARMSVVVVRPDRDEGDRRGQGIEQRP